MGINNRKRRVHKKQRKEKTKAALKKQKMRIENKPLGPVLQLMPNPFTGLKIEEVQKLKEDIAQSSENTYQDSLVKIKDILKSYDPFSLLSVLALYGLTTGLSDDGVHEKHVEQKIQQSHVEICQALALQINKVDLQKQPIHPSIVQSLIDVLIDLMHAYSFRNIAQGYESETAEQKAIRLLQYRMRSTTQLVRNWGYFSQVKSISRELYSHFDVPLEKKYGFSASNILNLFELILNEIETAISSRHQSLSKLYKLKDKTRLIYDYHELIGKSSVAADQFIKNVDISSIPYQSLFVMLMAHYELRLHEFYEFSPTQLSAKLNVDHAVVKNMLDTYSYELGALEKENTDYLFLSNPVWFRPIIKIDDDKYFCVCPQLFFSFVIPSLDRLVEDCDKSALNKRRANYLEDKIVQVINRRFPKANTVSRVKWKLGSVEYETDLITFIDSHAIIVEAKSGKISDPALRGAPDRIKKHIEEILLAPNVQSKRLKDKLEYLRDNPGVTDELRDKLPVDLTSIHQIIRVSVSLEDFGSIQANIANLKATKWLPDDFEACPTMNLADFDTLFDFLDHPVQIIHYLKRRQEIEASIGYMGDELDLMGLYIGTLFNLGDLDAEIDFVITGMSSPLDRYYNSKDAGVMTPKPKPIISSLFTSILEQLERRQTPRWTEIGVVLSRFSPDDQRRLVRMIEILKKNVKTKWMKENHKNIAICIPHGSSMYALCYVLYNNHTAHKRNDFIKSAVNQGFNHENVKQCLVIAKNMDKDDYTYHFIGLVERTSLF